MNDTFNFGALPRDTEKTNSSSPNICAVHFPKPRKIRGLPEDNKRHQTGTVRMPPALPRDSKGIPRYRL